MSKVAEVGDRILKIAIILCYGKMERHRRV